MKRVLTALVLIPLVLLAVFRAPDWLFTLLVGVVAVLATIEYLQIAAKYGYKLYRVVTVGAVAVLFAAMAYVEVFFTYQHSHLWFANAFFAVGFLGIIVLFGTSLFLFLGMRNEDLKSVLPGAALSLFAIPYIGASMLCVAVIRDLMAGWFFLLFTFFAVWVGDTAAYYVGRSFGKTKFAPRVSPKKTWEGAVASVVGAILVALLFTKFARSMGLAVWTNQPNANFYPPPLWVPAVMALVINVAAQLGDLFESLIKRGADVKDSGTMLPGHGGILDRIDALLFAAPVALVMILIFQSRFGLY
jgi:phosphatidate cytidylyltransferase